MIYCTTFNLGDKVVVTETGKEAVVVSIYIHVNESGDSELFNIRLRDGSIMCVNRDQVKPCPPPTQKGAE